MVRQPGFHAERPVRELVQHHGLGAVAARQRDRRAVVLFAVEGLAGAVAGAQSRHVPQIAVGEPFVPPEGADDAVDEPCTRLEPRERARRERGLGEVDATVVGRRVGGGAGVRSIGRHATLAAVLPRAPSTASAVDDRIRRRDHRPLEALQRERARGRRPELLRRAGSGLWPARPERRGEDHVPARAPRPHPTDRG